MIPPEVLDAFWLPHTATPLPGGQGNSWRVWDFVLKPHEEAYEWISLMVNQLKPQDFRVSYHKKSIFGSFTYQGWWCTEFHEGHEVTGKIEEKYSVARSLHDLFATIEKPEDWHPSDSPWSRAHAFVWWKGALPTNIHPQIQLEIDKVIHCLRPITLLNQIIHGDLCGNILFHETLPPLVIDFSLDYRPREYAEAILIADALAWENGWDEALQLLPPNSGQILLRACLFRLATKAFLRPNDYESFQKESAGYQKILQKLLR